MHESITHECLKSSLAFRKPAVAAASRRPARAGGPKVGLDGPASQKPRRRASSDLRGALGRLGYLCAGGAKAMFVAAADPEQADHSTLPVPSRAPQTGRLLKIALGTIH